MPVQHPPLMLSLSAIALLVACGGGSSETPSSSASVSPTPTAAPPAASAASVIPADLSASAAEPPASPASGEETRRQIAASPPRPATTAAPPPTAARPATATTAAADAQPAPTPSITSVGSVIRPATAPAPALPAALVALPLSGVSSVGNLAAELNGDALNQSSSTWSGINCHGQYGNWTRFMPAGIHGSRLPDGSTLRFGLVSDPLEPSRKVFAIRVHKDDPLTSGAKRCEVLAPGSGNTALPQKKDFWFAFAMRIVEGAVTKGDDQLLMQWHVDGLPILSLLVKDGRLRIENRYNANSTPTAINTSLLTPWRDSIEAPSSWMHFVVKARISAFSADRPYISVWRNGHLLFERQGPIGVNSVSLPFAKLGFYQWLNLNQWDATVPVRSIHLRHAVIVPDPEGRYNEASLRALIM